MSKLRVTARAQLMREIVDLLSVLTEEAKMSWGEKGLTVNVVDGSHVALLSATISDACFETYEVEPVEIGLELGKLRDLLTLAGPSDLVEIAYDDAFVAVTGDAFVAVHVRVGAIHRILRCFDMTAPKIAELDFDCSATIGAEEFSWALRAAKFVGELVDLSLDSKGMGVSATADSGESANVRFESDELSELVCPSPIRCKYGQYHLDPLTRKLASGLTQDIRVQFGENHPMRLDWISNDGGASWTFLLAPRKKKTV